MALSFCLAEGVRGRIDIANVSFGGYKEMWRGRGFWTPGPHTPIHPTDRWYLGNGVWIHNGKDYWIIINSRDRLATLY